MSESLYNSERFDKMVEMAMNALKEVFFLKNREKMLVVIDEEKEEIGKAFEQGGRRLGANVASYVLCRTLGSFIDIPNELRNLFDGQKVIVNTLTANPSETPFRLKLVKTELTGGALVGHAPGITLDMMTRGTMNVDYREMARKACHLVKAFEDGVRVRVTTKAGTDISLGIEGRAFSIDTEVGVGKRCNLPAGEVRCAPVENSGDGVIVVDGSISGLGLANTPLTLVIKNGVLTSIECEDKELIKKINKLVSVDNMARVVGELGFGLNPMARVTGNMLEDEKALETAHIALGNNTDFPGGKNISGTHRDFLFYKPNVEVRYKDGTKKIVFRNGKIL